MTQEYTEPFRIPFSGFKSTVHGLMVDHIIDMAIKEGNHDPDQAIPEFVIPEFKLRPEYCKVFLHEMARETGLDLKFHQVEAGDRIYATMALSQIEALHADMTETDIEKWKTMVANPEDYSGFRTSGLIPHPMIFHPRCSLDVNDWGPVATWQQGQHDYLFDFMVWPKIDEAVLANRAFERLSSIPGVTMIENVHDLKNMVDTALEQDRSPDTTPDDDSPDEYSPDM